MALYQKKHGIKLFKPLILPLTQVSKNISFLISSYTHQISSLCLMCPRPPKKTGGGGLYMAFSSGVMKMFPLVKHADTVYLV